ncbi:MAG: nucleotidyltransferase family protein [Syntrophales bacterium]
MDRNKEDVWILDLLFDRSTREADSVKTVGQTADNLDWDYIIVRCAAEKIPALVYYHLRERKLADTIPEESRHALETAYRDGLRRNLSILGQLKGVLIQLQKNEIPFIMLKGIALAENVYPRLALRPVSDIDILVRRCDVPRVDRTLAALGYCSVDSSFDRALKNPAGYLSSLEYRKNAADSLFLHIHWHLVNTSTPATMFAPGISLERFWKGAVFAETAGVECLVLSPEHTVIYLCEHALRVGHSFDRLILIYDIFRVIRKYEKEIRWEFLVNESVAQGLSRLVYLGLIIVRKYSGCELPDEVMEKLRPSRMSAGERLFLHLQLGNRRIRGSSYLVYLAMNRGVKNKLSFLWRTFFPPRAVLLQRNYDRRPGSGRRHYLSRVAEISRHLACAAGSLVKKNP